MRKGKNLMSSLKRVRSYKDFIVGRKYVYDSNPTTNNNGTVAYGFCTYKNGDIVKFDYCLGRKFPDNVNYGNGFEVPYRELVNFYFYKEPTLVYRRKDI